METFLRLKHWQVFIFAGAIGILSYALQLYQWGGQFSYGPRIDLARTKGTFEIIEHLAFWLVLWWLYAIATKLNELLPAGYPGSMRSFKQSLFALVAILPLTLYITQYLGGPGIMTTVVVSILPFLLLTYCYYIVAKMLMVIEGRKQ